MTTFTLPEITLHPGIYGFLSPETVDLHYHKHHQGYVDKLNELVLQKSELKDLSLEDLILKTHREQDEDVFNQAGQHYNHSLYWKSIHTEETYPPKSGLFFEALKRTWGSMDLLHDDFQKQGMALFGSGWIWMTQNEHGKVEICATKDSESPLLEGKKPLFVCDVWEHAYYLDYRNERSNYLKSFWKHISWGFAEATFLELHSV